ncbi:hypothetical protein HKD37_10G028550 [Glycine soja]
MSTNEISDGICGRHLQIMVRTRGLGRALGHDTGKGVGRGDRDDSDDAPQRRRSTASPRRQRVPVTTANNEPVVLATEVEGASIEADVYADEPIAGGDVQDTGVDNPANTGAQAAEDEPKGFSGGLRDPSVLTEYEDYVVGSVWTGEERPELKLSSHRRNVHSLGMPVPAIEGLVAGTGLSPLIVCLIDTSDRGLLSLFVERWYWEASSDDHADDVASLLHLPVVGDLHVFQPVHVDDVVQMLVELLMVTAEAVRAETAQCHGLYRRCHVGHWTTAARAFLLHLLGCTLFANKSATHCWIYEHFPSVVESTADPNYDEDSPRACMWIATKKIVKSMRTPTYRERLDRIHIFDVCWIPYREHRPVQDFHMISCYSDLLRWGPVVVYYRPERVMQQFGYTKTIPTPPADSWVSGCTSRTIWLQQVTSALCQRLHGLILPHFASIRDTGPAIRSSGRWSCYAAQSCPSGSRHRYPSGHEASSIVDICKVRCGRAETCSACFAIAERLESHLNLEVVTPGTSTHVLIEECLKIAKSVTQDPLVYVRSRRRRCTDQS